MGVGAFKGSKNVIIPNTDSANLCHSTIHKGLRNLEGQNNCFLNVNIQALWHLGSFRQGFEAILRDRNSSNSSVLPNSLMAAICDMFDQYHFNQMEIIPPDVLRKALSDISEDFPLDSIADANEALEVILKGVHNEIVGARHRNKITSNIDSSSIDSNGSCSENTECSPAKHSDECFPETCLAHKTFCGVLMEQVTCMRCGATSEPNIQLNFVHQFYAAEIINYKLDGLNTNSVTTFARLLHGCLNFNKRKCPSNDDDDSSARSPTPSDLGSASTTSPSVSQPAGSTNSSANNDNVRSVTTGSSQSLARTSTQGSLTSHCKGIGRTDVRILDIPTVLALAVCWTSDNEQSEMLREFYNRLGLRIPLNELFPNDDQVQKKRSIFKLPKFLKSKSGNKIDPNSIVYSLKGFLCYYGKHYVSFFRESPGINTANDSGSSSMWVGHDEWLLFDDHSVRKVGNWDMLKDLCCSARYQPVLLLYEDERVPF